MSISLGTCLWVTGTIHTMDDPYSEYQINLIVLAGFLLIHSIIFTLISYFWGLDIQTFLT